MQNSKLGQKIISNECAGIFVHHSNLMLIFVLFFFICKFYWNPHKKWSNKLAIDIKIRMGTIWEMIFEWLPFFSLFSHYSPSIFLYLVHDYLTIFCEIINKPSERRKKGYKNESDKFWWRSKLLPIFFVINCVDENKLTNTFY